MGPLESAGFPGGIGNRPRVDAINATLLALLLALPTTSFAADGCMVLLCLAAPSWQNIGQCVDPVRQVLRDLARGKPFPSCDMSGAGNSASNQPANAPAFCPPQYTHSYANMESVLACDYDAAVVVNVNGALWSRTWWRFAGGDTVTEFTPTAKAQLGSWDPRFDDDYTRWLASVPPACVNC